MTNLLRDNTLPVMLLMAFAQVEGAEFLRGTFYQPLQVIIAVRHLFFAGNGALVLTEMLR